MGRLLERHFPSGVAADFAGNLFVADGDSYTVFRILNTQGPVLSFQNVTTNDAGDYQVIIADASGSVTSSVATLTIDTQTPITILTQPAGQTVLAGSNVTFEVGLFGATPITYQWKLDGTNLPGATNPTVTLTNVGLASAGSYTLCQATVSARC